MAVAAATACSGGGGRHGDTAGRGWAGTAPARDSRASGSHIGGRVRRRRKYLYPRRHDRARSCGRYCRGLPFSTRSPGRRTRCRPLPRQRRRPQRGRQVGAILAAVLAASRGSRSSIVFSTQYCRPWASPPARFRKRERRWRASATTAPTASNLGVRYSLLLKGADGEYAPARLAAEFHPGDSVRLRLEPNDSGYLYLFQRDAAGGWRLASTQRV